MMLTISGEAMAAAKTITAYKSCFDDFTLYLRVNVADGGSVVEFSKGRRES